MKSKAQQKAFILSKILSNYSQEKQAILKDDPKYFKRILRKRTRLFDILRSLENEE